MVRQIKQSGFTLLELTIVLGVIGLLLSGVLVFANNIYTEQQEVDTETRIDEIVTAIEHYYVLNDRLPCPASRADLPGAATFGREVEVGADCQSYTVAPAGTLRVETAASSGVWFLVGVVPVRDLMLSDELMGDAYGNRFSYVVMQELTDSTTFSAGAGAMTIKDGAGNNIVTDGAYVVFSHGKDGMGAYRVVSGSLKAACGATNLDIENCDWDVTYIDAPFNDGDVAASFFDDYIRWRSKEYYEE